MNKKLVAFLLSCSMLGGFSMNVFANNDKNPSAELGSPVITAGNAVTVGAAEAPMDRSVPQDQRINDIQKKSLDDLLQKYGLDQLDLSFEKMSYHSVFSEEDRVDVEQKSKTLGMRGWTDDVATLFVARTDNVARSSMVSYQLEFAVFIDNKNAMIDAAVIKAYPYPFYNEGSKIYSFDSKLQGIGNEMSKYMNDNIYSPSYAKQDKLKPFGYRANEKISTAMKNYFLESGWDLGKSKAYHNANYIPDAAINKKYQTFLAEEEINSAMQASANGGPQVMMMPNSGFYFAEKTYKFKDSNNKYHVMFCAFGLNPDKKDAKPTFSWIIARPEKYNMNGDFNRHFYPVNVKMKEISKDMKSYFSNKNESLPPGAVN